MTDEAKTTSQRGHPDLRHINGPFDIIGDVHGCVDELLHLLHELGYEARLYGVGEGRRAHVKSPAGRRAVFVGDLVDRGPSSPDVLRIVLALVAEGRALCVPGNHDVKFVRWLAGRNVKLTHGLDRTAAQFEFEIPGVPDSCRYVSRKTPDPPLARRRHLGYRACRFERGHGRA